MQTADFRNIPTVLDLQRGHFEGRAAAADVAVLELGGGADLEVDARVVEDEGEEGHQADRGDLGPARFQSRFTLI